MSLITVRCESLVDGLGFFCPTFDSVRYKVHCLPNGYVSVPNNDNVDSVVGGWEFHYN